MNIDTELVTRALAKAGQEPLNDEDIEKNSARWRLIKSFYLSTILETLSKTAWTSCKKIAQLTEEAAENHSGYSYAYTLPVDCAKPDQITDNEEYDVIGRTLYTNSENPYLLYISDGFVGNRYELPETQPSLDNFAENDYYILNEDGTYTQTNVYSASTTYYILSTDDYPKYDTIEFEPLLKEYIEARLASKIVLKITGDQQLYQMLYQEAQLAERNAVDATIAHSHSKENGDEWWADTLGLGGII